MKESLTPMRIGADYLGAGRCAFTVWAPHLKRLAVRLLDPEERLLPMDRLERGYWRTVAERVPPASHYLLCLDGGEERPDPASSFQPLGVHGPSQVVDHAAFAWTDGGWSGIPLEELVIYELHVGTFSREGTFAAILPRLAELRELGITAVELMPVAQFPGEHNWGYDGASPFAVQNSYGGPEGLKTLVDACHRQGLAVILDVVYNHLGPEGNCLRDFGPYFTDRYRTPWGEAVNFDGPCSDEVRRFFVENALFWFRHYHVDALRLDAVHAICDFSATSFLQELAERSRACSRQLKRPCHLIAESDLNAARLTRSAAQGGAGLDAQWNDDFHHAVHALLTGEKDGYYGDFGTLEDLATAYREGFVYSRRYSPYRRRHHGSSSADVPGRRFVAFSQNHDQVGNRMHGERLIALAGFEAAKVAAAALFLSPFLPLLFMGEEYGEEAPFLFFASFSDPGLRQAVHRGRQGEFRAFAWAGEPPDPHDPETFRRSKLHWEERQRGRHRVMLGFYRQWLRLRRQLPALAVPDKENLEAAALGGRLFSVRRWRGESHVLGLFNFGREPASCPFPAPRGEWKKAMDSAEPRWLGSGPCLPSRVRGREPVTVPAVSCALFLGEPEGQ